MAKQIIKWQGADGEYDSEAKADASLLLQDIANNIRLEAGVPYNDVCDVIEALAKFPEYVAKFNEMVDLNKR
jgi:hypothetical protein